MALMELSMLRRIFSRLPGLAPVVVCLLLCAAQTTAHAQGEQAQRLRIVGGLAGLNQYKHHEEPFWTKTLPRVTGGRATAEIVPFDQAGLRGQEMLRLIQLGAVPFGTALLTLVASEDPELGAVDLSGLSPDMAALRRNVTAFRPHMIRRLRERWGIEALAVYVYPAQVMFCSKPFSRLDDLAGRRIRSSSTSQSDLIEALGAIPVQMPFAEVVPSLRSGAIECAITGTMSGNTVGLHEVTSHIHPLAISWGLAVFGANSGAWKALPESLRTVLRGELAGLEQRIWTEAERETSEGIACNTGAPSCRAGRRGAMAEIPESPADAKRLRELFTSVVLPRWAGRCGRRCETVWNATIGPAAGVMTAAGK